MRRVGTILTLTAAALILALVPPAPRPATAQQVGLAADGVEIDEAARTVTATGNVTIEHQGRVLRADEITFDEAANAIRARGPLLLTEPDGSVLFADAATLDPALAEGLIRGARLMIAGTLQVAASEVRRTEGRYTILHGTVASSCEICIGAPAPTWAIRADRVIRDEAERRIHFRSATLELFGLPVAWLPYLRIPDPEVDRASGVLVPELRRSQIYGAGLRVPYYQVLGPSADATLTPFVTERGGTLIEGAYRRRFDRASLELSGVLTAVNRLDDRSLRGSLGVLGAVELGGGFLGEADIALTSDEDFLQQYDYSEADRLTSTVGVSRTRAVDTVSIAATGFQSLRPDEDQASVPFILPEAGYRRVWQDALAGGRIGLDLDALGVLRAEGRDMLRLGGGVDWRRDAIIGPGLVAAASLGAAVDAYRLWNDPARADGTIGRIVPSAALELRWPLVRAAPGASHVIEPIGHLAWSTRLGARDVPNEDSQLPEFDETNLFAPSRFPGRDRVETGARLGLGLGYTRLAASGWQAEVTAGRVFRLSEERQFAAGTGLRGRRSDWVGAVALDLPWGVSLLNRVQLDDGLELRRNEFGLDYAGSRAALSASFVFLAADASNPDLGPQPRSSELALDGALRIAPQWRLSGNWRYDAVAARSIRAGGGLTYGNECAEFDLSVSRRFTASASVPPSTSVGFTVRLIGLGAAGSQDWPARTCRG
ncbi:LPS assembly protein LptD [soil metagenome]